MPDYYLIAKTQNMHIWFGDAFIINECHRFPILHYTEQEARRKHSDHATWSAEVKSGYFWKYETWDCEKEWEGWNGPYDSPLAAVRAMLEKHCPPRDHQDGWLGFLEEIEGGELTTEQVDELVKEFKIY